MNNKHVAGLDKRDFLCLAASATALALLPQIGMAAEANPPSETEASNIRLVNAFCAAWASKDLTKVLPFLSEDVVYRMTETIPAVHGHQGVSDALSKPVKESDQVEFRILETFARGPIVMNHRIDHFASKARPLTWEGVGVFFVKDGKIKEWSDYTIKVTQGS